MNPDAAVIVGGIGWAVGAILALFGFSEIGSLLMFCVPVFCLLAVLWFLIRERR